LRSEVSAPLALIVNELVTNAVKYGRTEDHALRVRIGLHRAGAEFQLAVEDNGPGFEIGNIEKRSSGLGLVRGLARQLGGSFRVERCGGARCVLSFPNT
jgi:two-component sensor histidine kinase